MSINDLKTGCIGTGNMGGAILSRLSTAINKKNIYCYDADKKKSDSFASALGIVSAASVSEIAEKCDIIILAVKPDVVKAVSEEIKKIIGSKLVISIAAGVSTGFIRGILGSSSNVVRVMPNTPAMIGHGMTIIAESQKESLKLTDEIFSLLGKTVVLPEKYIDAGTAVSGCGPAYFYSMLQAMADGGVKMGLPRDKALLLAAQTAIGAAMMVLETKEDPVTLRGKVTSPGGSTIDAVHVLEKAGFAGIVMDAVEAAKIKSEKLGV